MLTILLLTAGILLIFAFERTAVHMLTSSDARIRWVQKQRLLHPNAISLIRIPMGVLTAGLWCMGLQEVAIIWFSFWMITDITDGTLARKCDLATETGKWLDPLSDKCMYFPLLVSFSLTPPFPIPYIWLMVFLLLDTLGQASRHFLRKKSANYFGKVKTTLITILLAAVALNFIHDVGFLSAELFYLLTVSCTILAFLSIYCKVIPDNWYANTLTLANFLCGLAASYSIVFADAALLGFILIFAGQFFDLFDGRLARKFGSTRHAAAYDDIADATSFGLAIALLVAHHFDYSPLACTGALLYFASVVYRLIRFTRNRTSASDSTFEGLPSPAGALIVGASLLVTDLLQNATPFTESHELILSMSIVLLTSVLHVCHIRYLHFGRDIWPALPNFAKIFSFVLFLILLNLTFAYQDHGTTFKLFCFFIGWLYVFLGRARTPGPAQRQASSNVDTP